MSWHYRVVKDVTKIPLGDIDISYAIHSVYIDENNNVVNISEKPLYPIADDAESLIWQLQKMIEACKKPVIEYNSGEDTV